MWHQKAGKSAKFVEIFIIIMSWVYIARRRCNNHLLTPPENFELSREYETYLMSRNGYKWSHHLFTLILIYLIAIFSRYSNLKHFS